MLLSSIWIWEQQREIFLTANGDILWLDTRIIYSISFIASVHNNNISEKATPNNTHTHLPQFHLFQSFVVAVDPEWNIVPKWIQAKYSAQTQYQFPPNTFHSVSKHAIHQIGEMLRKQFNVVVVCYCRSSSSACVEILCSSLLFCNNWSENNFETLYFQNVVVYEFRVRGFYDFS